MKYSNQSIYIAENQMRRRSLSLPHSAKGIFNANIKGIILEARRRAWCLPSTTLADEVSHYCKRHKDLNLKGPRPKLRRSLDSSEAASLAGQIDVALKFLNLAQEADPTVKPILLYYACTQLCGVYTRLFFDWKSDRRSHGLTCSHIGQPENVGKIIMYLQAQGQFPRLATTCFLLTGMPSCFSELVTYSASSSAHTDTGELLETFGTVEKGEPIGELTLEEICNFDYGPQLKKVRSRHGFHKFEGLSTTAFLMDVITLFVASSIARYDVLGWREILEGKTNSYWLHFDSTFERFQNFTVDRLLAMMQDSNVTLGGTILYGVRGDVVYHSPYSDSDDSRFEGNPNAYGL